MSPDDVTSYLFPDLDEIQGSLFRQSPAVERPRVSPRQNERMQLDAGLSPGAYTYLQLTQACLGRSLVQPIIPELTHPSSSKDDA
jgi:hypothetical protein